MIRLLLMVALCAAPSLARADGGAGARLALEPALFDFGNVRPEKKLQKEIVLRNVGDSELVIKKVSTTCSCTVVGTYLLKLAPGASTKLRIELSTPAVAGRTEQAVAIETNDPARPRVEVLVAATVVVPRKPTTRTDGTPPD